MVGTSKHILKYCCKPSDAAESSKLYYSRLKKSRRHRLLDMCLPQNKTAGREDSECAHHREMIGDGHVINLIGSLYTCIKSPYTL